MILSEIVAELYAQKIGPCGPLLFEKIFFDIIASVYQLNIAQSVVHTKKKKVLFVIVGLSALAI